jgi:ankyrin repeat protein
VARLLASRGAKDSLPARTTAAPALASAVDSADILPGATPLIYAAWRGNADLVERIVADGADIAARDQEGKTALHRAAERGHGDIAGFLLARGADASAAAADGATPLMEAAAGGHAGIANLLVQRGARTGGRGPNSQSACRWPSQPAIRRRPGRPARRSLSRAGRCVVDQRRRAGVDRDRAHPPGQRRQLMPGITRVGQR